MADAAGVVDRTRAGAASFALRFDRPEIGQRSWLELRLCDRIATLVTALRSPHLPTNVQRPDAQSQIQVAASVLQIGSCHKAVYSPDPGWS
eukprot:3004965-Prymnesium_polylepis.1